MSLSTNVTSVGSATAGQRVRSAWICYILSGGNTIRNFNLGEMFTFFGKYYEFCWAFRRRWRPGREGGRDGR